MIYHTVTEPTISVVTPSYNQASYLCDNLDSVERQIYDNIEHIILDGGSTDSSQFIIEEYANRVPYDVIWRSEPDEGQSAAINEGFDRANGDIVAWLNSDDVYFDRTVFSRVAAWFDETNSDVLYGDLAYVNEHSRVTEIDVRPEFDRAKLAHRILIGQPATFFRQEVLEMERLSTNLEYCMDYEFWVRLSAEYDFQHVRNIFAGFRRHESQKTDDMGPVNDEVELMLQRYNTKLPPPRHVYATNAVTEARRLSAAVAESLRVALNPPILAFDGKIAPLPELLSNVGPSRADLQRVVNRID